MDDKQQALECTLEQLRNLLSPEKREAQFSRVVAEIASTDTQLPEPLALGAAPWVLAPPPAPPRPYRHTLAPLGMPDVLLGVAKAAIGLYDPVVAGKPAGGAYMLPEHALRFLAFAVQNNVFISARRTGTDSCVRLRGGLACKPHTILGKSIKPKSYTAANRDYTALSAAIWANASSLLRVELVPPENQGDVLFFRSATAPGASGAAAPEAAGGRARVPWRTVRTEAEFGCDAAGVTAGLLSCIWGWSAPSAPSPAEGVPAPAAAAVAAQAGVPAAGAPAAELAAEITAILGYANQCLEKALQPAWIGYVGCWCTLEVDFADDVTIGERTAKKHECVVPIGVLRVGPLNDRHKAPAAGLPIPFDRWVNTGRLPLFPPEDGYTGDYDLHCVFQDAIGKAQDVRPRPPKLEYHAGDHGRYEVSAHDTDPEPLPPRADPTEKTPGLLQMWIDVLNAECRRQRNIPEPPPRVASDTYAQVIQHGPQNLYEKFVRIQRTQNDAIKPLMKLGDAPQDAVAKKHVSESPIVSLMTLDGDGILAFAPTGEVAVLSNANAVLAYYKRHNIKQSAWIGAHGVAIGALTQHLLPDLTRPTPEQWRTAKKQAIAFCAALQSTFTISVPKEARPGRSRRGFTPAVGGVKRWLTLVQKVPHDGLTYSIDLADAPPESFGAQGNDRVWQAVSIQRVAEQLGVPLPQEPTGAPSARDINLDWLYMQTYGEGVPLWRLSAAVQRAGDRLLELRAATVARRDAEAASAIAAAAVLDAARAADGAQAAAAPAGEGNPT